VTQRSQETPGRLFTRRQRALFRSLPGALVGEEESIHRLRVAGRRLRLALPLLAARPDRKRVVRARDTVRQLGLAAGRARDIDVMLDLLDRRLIGLGRFTREQILLRRRLRAAQRRSRQRMVETLLDTNVASLRQDLRALQGSGLVEAGVLSSRVAGRARAEARAAAAMLPTIRRLDVDKLHGLRRRVRRLRYLAEISHELFDLDERTATQLKQVQEKLGAIRDGWLLTDWLRRVERRARARGERGPAGAARGLARHFGRVTREHYAAWRAPITAQTIGRCARRIEASTRALLQECSPHGMRG